ncbi:xanthine dehydrogenase accessory protein XdhC [Azospira inquinata]|uniref:Xanthine dehydrogenase accessory protein XdhC n=1 Tax=Azospira inquinata TaxID=2785627 RepID=A0A975SLW1_9RHOO|nr:xanthine dehydrogenase accessory protein XdhC [Azospira inquinata]QWT45925.1 xanthine dehydrogenase accessory protein XdhC [Azospira inquinata]QWT48748.1 xanthine dehydrogenase accessory protein XdhC [Azospira inquinata]
MTAPIPAARPNAAPPASPLPWFHALADFLREGPAVLVTVARLQGSTPRETGAAMVVGKQGFADTIGGGHLEWVALEEARRLLGEGQAHPEAAQPPRLVSYSLAATLGQCCGGTLWLLYEVIAPDALAAWQEVSRALARGDSWRREVVGPLTDRDARALSRGTPLEGPEHKDSLPGIGAKAEATPLSAHQTWEAAPCQGLHPLPGNAGWLAPELRVGSAPAPSATPSPAYFRYRETLTDRALPLMIFGAGHVGAALVRALSLLDVRITWVDCRPELFPGDLPPRVTPLVLEDGEDLPGAAQQAQPGTYFLVLTHNHDLDYAICEAIFRRQDYAYFGLIGSATKRARFEHRLVARGLDPARLGELTCPIGIPGIGGKEPAVIAASVVAQILQVRDACRASARPPESLPTDASASVKTSVSGPAAPATLFNQLSDFSR